MSIFNVLSLAGGLALFLFGMNTMEDSLSKLSGGRMEKLLEKLTSKKIMAVLLGAVVTAVIQSSSATTVMVVGFVNSGIMRLSQAIGIIMGANIGTTVTSWILSLAGIESSNFFIKLLKPTSFSPILALVGIVLIMFFKSEKKKIIGNILIGFAILMFGMDMMSTSVAPLAEVEEFTGILTAFSNPILGMLAGALLTAVIQSSSASVGILQALCLTGAVSYATALPIIMGQNIGTCVTAIMSGVGASKNAKRAAMIHLYFNVIGTVLFMIVFYSINAFVHFEFLNDAAPAAGIAVLHSLFNIICTVVLLPFGSYLEKLAILTIPDKEKESDTDELSGAKLLDERFLLNPGYALNECHAVAVNMAKTAKDALFLSLDLITGYNKKDAGTVEKLEQDADRYEDALVTYLSKLSGKNLTEKESLSLTVMNHCISDFERISDHALNISERSKQMNKNKLKFSRKAMEELDILADSLREIISLSVNAFESGNLELARRVEPLEQVIDKLTLEEKKRHLKRVRKGKCTLELGFILSDLLTDYERVADHCSNIAVYILQSTENGFETHEYLDIMKDIGNEEFARQYKELRSQYSLRKKERNVIEFKK